LKKFEFLLLTGAADDNHSSNPSYKTVKKEKMKHSPNRYLHTINMFRECQNLNTIDKNTGIKTYRFRGS